MSSSVDSKQPCPWKARSPSTTREIISIFRNLKAHYPFHNISPMGLYSDSDGSGPHSHIHNSVRYTRNKKKSTPVSYIKSCPPSAVLPSVSLIKILCALLVPPIRVITHTFLVMVIKSLPSLCTVTENYLWITFYYSSSRGKTTMCEA